MKQWDKDKIVAALIDRKSRGLALNTGAIQKSDSALARAIFKHFRFHDAALLAAGIDPASVRKWSSWDKARVVAALRARRDAGMALSFAAIYREDTPLGGGIAAASARTPRRSVRRASIRKRLARGSTGGTRPISSPPSATARPGALP